MYGCDESRKVLPLLLLFKKWVGFLRFRDRRMEKRVLVEKMDYLDRCRDDDDDERDTLRGRQGREAEP